MSQLSLPSVIGGVDLAKTFCDLRLTLEKARQKMTVRLWLPRLWDISLKLSLWYFLSNASKRHRLATGDLTWNDMRHSAVLLQRHYGKILTANIRCVHTEYMHVPAFLGWWHCPEGRTHTHAGTHTHTHTHSVLCMRWLTCRDIWLVLETLFGAARWLQTTHNRRKKEKEKALME